MTGFNTKVTPEIENLTQMCVDHSSMDVSLYGKYDVKRGLRDSAGAREYLAADICLKYMKEAVSIPCPEEKREEGEKYLEAKIKSLSLPQPEGRLKTAEKELSGLFNREIIFTENPRNIESAKIIPEGCKLAGKPKILILDEPTTGMDMVSVKTLAEVLRKRNEEQGLTILMVTHGNSGEFKGANRFFKAEEGRIDEV